MLELHRSVAVGDFTIHNRRDKELFEKLGQLRAHTKARKLLDHGRFSKHALENPSG